MSTKRRSASEALARKTMESVTKAMEKTEEQPPVEGAQPKRTGGRPRGAREVANKQTVYLDAPRYEALVEISRDHGRSIHSLILEGIDHVIGRPRKRWGD